jgi:hypothetical protein
MVKDAGADNLSDAKVIKEKNHSVELANLLASSDKSLKSAQIQDQLSSYTALAVGFLDSKKDALKNAATNAALVYLLNKALTNPISEFVVSDIASGTDFLLDMDVANRIAKILLSPVGALAVEAKNTLLNQANPDHLVAAEKAVMAVFTTQMLDILKSSVDMNATTYFAMFLAGRTLVDMYYSTARKEDLPKVLLQSLATNAAICIGGLYLPTMQNQVMTMLSSTALSTQAVGSSILEGVKSIITLPNLKTIVGSYISLESGPNMFV